jgi:hypothetical protein
VCDKAGSQKAWAKTNGFSPPFIGDIIRERRDVSEAVMNALGNDKLIVCRKKKEF